MNNEYLTSSEQLTAFLDGELGNEQTSQLFAELAHNTDLQSEMQDLVSIRNTFRNSQLNPPDSLKYGILISSGLEKATFINRIRAGASAASAIWALLNSRTAYTAYTIAILVGLWFMIDFSGIKNTQQDFAKVTNSNQNTISNSKSNPNIAIVKSDEVPNSKVKDAEKVPFKKSNFSTLATNSKKRNAPIVEENKEIFNSSFEDNQIKSSPINYSDYVFAKNNFSVYNRTNENNGVLGFASLLNREFLDKISIQFRTFNGMSFPTQSVDNSNSPMLNNFSLALMYNLNPKFSLGIEGGFENFAMSFDGYEGDILYNYNQNFNSVWGGISAQYLFGSVFGVDEFEPYVRTLVAANELGPVLKLGTGAKYYINNNLSLVGGFEWGWFAYSNAGNYYNTNKFGYSLGFLFNL